MIFFVEKTNTSLPLEIVFESSDLIAINKPNGLLVHRSRIAKDAKEFALQKLRDQIGARVFLTHRLDRKTSGVLLFAKNEEANKTVQKLFSDRKVNKIYHAIVRGFIQDQGVIDYPLTEERKTKEAITSFQCLQHFEINLPFGKHATSRYSLVELKPSTGRYHQLRKHMAHIFHPIIGDRPHGCNKQNKLWKTEFNMTSMLLHAKHLHFSLDENQVIEIEAKYSPAFQKVLSFLEEKNQSA